MSHDLWHDINQFLIREARLLDEGRFEEWLEHFTEDATHWMPGRTNPTEDVVHDGKPPSIFF